MKTPISKSKQPPPEVKAKPGAASKKADADKKKTANTKKGDAKTTAKKKKRRPIVLPRLDRAVPGVLNPMWVGRGMEDTYQLLRMYARWACGLLDPALGRRPRSRSLTSISIDMSIF